MGLPPGKKPKKAKPVRTPKPKKDPKPKQPKKGKKSKKAAEPGDPAKRCRWRSKTQHQAVLLGQHQPQDQVIQTP